MSARWWISLFFLVLTAVFCLLHLGDPQLLRYDEARRAVNAYEMAFGDGHLLVPTYGGEPDHWGTKPPLLVWLQACWMRLLGPTETAVRLPSALATLAVGCLLTWWAGRRWESPVVGATAALLLVSNWAFLGNHGARTGDFDALLTLFVVVQMIGLFEWVRSGRMAWLTAAGAGLLLAGWTKGIAAGFLLPGIGLWLLLEEDGRKRLTEWRLYATFISAIAGVVAYYFLRERVDPGYLELVAGNELGGRFAEVSEGHDQPWYFYLVHLFMDGGVGYLYWLIFPALYLGYRLSAFRAQVLLLVCTVGSVLLVISLSATKLYWYQTPLLPGLSLLVAWVLYRLARAGDGVGEGGRFGALLAAMLLLPPVLRMASRVANPVAYQEVQSGAAPFRDFLARGDVEGPYSVVVEKYGPSARFYTYVGRHGGKDVRLKHTEAQVVPLVATPRPVDEFHVGERVVVCTNETVSYLHERFYLDLRVDGGACKLFVVGREWDEPPQ